MHTYPSLPVLNTSPLLLRFCSKNLCSFNNMPKSTRKGTSMICRFCKADCIALSGLPAMRPCSQCVAALRPCVVSELLISCSKCYHYHRSCDLAPPDAEIDKTLEAKEQVEQQLIDAHRELANKEAEILACTRCLRKQKHFLQKCLRALGDWEDLNIAELKVDETCESMILPSLNEFLSNVPFNQIDPLMDFDLSFLPGGVPSKSTP